MTPVDVIWVEIVNVFVLLLQRTHKFVALTVFISNGDLKSSVVSSFYIIFFKHCVPLFQGRARVYLQIFFSNGIMNYE